MKTTLKYTLAALAFALLTACGGGGGSGDSTDLTIKHRDPLQGTWVYASDQNFEGGSCGLDLQGNFGRRLTMTITGSTYRTKDESCIILSGNTGFYLESDSGEGAINIGEIYLYDQQDPANNLRAIDFISDATVYTAYRIEGAELFLSDSLRARTGLTPELRAYNNLIKFNRLDGGSADSVASTSTFPLLTVLANTLQASSNTFSISGTINGVAITGLGTATSGALSAGTFEGSSAQQRTNTATGTIVVNGQNIPLNSSSISWYNSNYSPLGNSGGEDYVVVVGSAVIPATVRVNDTANIYTANRYSNSSKTVLRGIETISYVVEADTATTALLTLISTERNTSNTVTSTSTQQILITPAGTFTRIKETLLEDSSVLTLTYN